MHEFSDMYPSRRLNVVIDLSALRGLSGARIAALCAQHDVWMTEALFYELMTTQDHVARAAAFRKIGPAANPLRLISNAGYLWGRELSAGRPTDPIADSDALQDVSWIFNPVLQDPDFHPLDHLPDLVDWQREMHAKVAAFEQRAQGVASAFFPNLLGVRAGERARVDPVLRDLGEDHAVVMSIFRLLAEAEGKQVPDVINHRWMGFRLLQSQLMWAVDHLGRYGEGTHAVAAPRIENTFCDVEYAAIAAHADALLTRDALQAELFQRMAPSVYCGPDLVAEGDVDGVS